MAVPAKPGLITMTQPDGTEIKVQLKGDERHHFYMSEDGYLLTVSDKTFYYADIDSRGVTVNSGIPATPAASRPASAKKYLADVDMTHVLNVMQGRATVACDSRYNRAPSRSGMTGSTNPDRGLFPGSHFPVHGKQKGLVILVDYPDKEFTVDAPHDYFNRMLNEPGFDDNGGTGSARDYFMYNSRMQFMPEFDVYGPVTLPKKYSYYGGNDWDGKDEHPHEMVIDACDILAPTVDFSQYDCDGDGVIDNVFIFYAGRGEASGGDEDTVWPHAWNVTAGDSKPHIYNGVILDRYACTNEWEKNRPDGVGTFIHEFSHVMGLPDLYATTYTNAFTPGSWSALDYGPYNNDGNTPPNYGAFERYALGWMEPTELKDPANATLYSIDSNEAGVVYTDNDNEFFLIEKRQKDGWDEFIPASGILIWHIHYDASIWQRNVVNNNSYHQYVDIEEADGTRTEASRDGDVFPGTAGKTAFGPLTIPSMKPWTGKAPNVPLTEITKGISDSAPMTFKVRGGSDEIIPAPVALEATDVTASSFTINWEPVVLGDGEETPDYIISIEFVNDLIDAIPYFNGIRIKGGQTSYVMMAEPDMKFIYTVRAARGLHMSEPSNDIEVSTPSLSLAEKAVEALDAENITETSFMASWLALDDATEYMLTVIKQGTDTPIPGYDAVVVGSNTECMVDGLEPSTTYEYYVVATDGELTSLPSQHIAVTTLAKQESGITDITSGSGIKADTDGLTLTLTGAPSDIAVDIYNTAGMTVASGRTATDGTCTIHLPASGIYVVRAGQYNLKIII